jgi:lipopolysaccharide transport system ATP-binding protein
MYKQDINFEATWRSFGYYWQKRSGKSTLLKILSKVTAPTTGSIKSRGRIALLLSRNGFNGEMTGRENIFERCHME